MRLSEVFRLHQGNGFELCNMNLSSKKEIGFVSRTAQNNGVVAYVHEEAGRKPFPAGYITVALGGSVLSSFVQFFPFYTAYHVMVLEPKREMSLNEKLYYCMCIQNNAYRYSYGRQANKTLKDIDLPDVIPDWVYRMPVMPIKSEILPRVHDFDTATWKEFDIGGAKGVFKIESCKCGNAGDLIAGDDLYYIGAKKNDNGVMKKVAYDDRLVTKGNCIVFICDGQGSVGYSNYMDRDFIGSTTLSVGYHKQLNKYNALFLVTILDLERPKYSYGRKYRKHLEHTKIKLPATKEGKPDFAYMENFIKQMKYSDKI